MTFARTRGALRVEWSTDVALIAHGDLTDQLASESELEVALASIEINFTSVVALAIPLANYFEARGEGHFGVITSVAGERGRLRNYTYGAAKGGLNRYLGGRRHGDAGLTLDFGVDTQSGLGPEVKAGDVVDADWSSRAGRAQPNPPRT